MKKMKKIFSLALAGALAMSVMTSCGGGGAQSSQASQPSGESGGGSAPAEPVTLTWALWDWNLGPYFKALVDAYEDKNPNVKIEYKDLGSADYNMMLSTQLTGSDSGLDVVTVKDTPGYVTTTNAGQLLDLTQFIKDEGIDTSVYGGTVEQITRDGKVYALPFRSDFWVVYYNKDLFDAAGVEYPTNDMTLNDYDALARKMTSGSGAEKVYGAHYHTWRSAVQLFGILDGKHTVLDGDYGFLKPYYELVLKEQKDGICQDYATLKTNSTHYSGVFFNNQAAMMNMGSWFITTQIDKVKSGESLSKNWGIVKYPHPDGVEAGTTLGTITSLAVSANSKNQEAALDFVKFVTGEEGAKIIAGTGTIPAIKSDEVIAAIASMDGFPQDDNSKEALKTVKTYLEMPVHNKGSEIETALNEAHDNIMTENVTVDEGLQEMKDNVAPLLG